MKKLMFLWVSLLLAGAQMLQAQRTITGTVVSSEDNQGLPGVQVVAKGTTSGTTTNVQGQYSLNVPSGATHLVFSFMGMTTQEIEIGGQSTIDVVMQSGSQDLEAVIVTAYGTAKKSTFTGSAAAVGGEKLAKRTVTNIGNALEGNVAGVQVTSASGQPGSSGDIRIRGIGSINASNAPLYIVDGVTFAGVLSNLNPDDVESVTVLKDAASSALYGSRAANGVVVITTKSGNSQRPGFDVKVTQGFSSRAIQEYEIVSPQEYYELAWYNIRNGETYKTKPAADPCAYASANLISLLGYNITNVANNLIVGTDGKFNPEASILSDVAGDLNWFDPIQRLGKRTEVTTSASAGNKNSDMRASFAYMDEEGYIIGSDFSRFSGRLNMNHRVNRWFKTGMNISASSSKSHYTNVESSTGYVNPFYFARNIGPIYPVYAHDLGNSTGVFLYDADGNKLYDVGSGSSSYTAMIGGSLGQTGSGVKRGSGANVGRHVVAEVLMNRQLATRNAFGGKMYFEITFLKDFKFTNNLSYDMYFLSEDNTTNKYVGDGAPAGRAQKYRNSTQTLTSNQLLNYTKTLSKVHHIDVLLGHEAYKYDYAYLYGFKEALTLEDNPEFISYTTINNLNSYTRAYRLESYFARANYSMNDKYFGSLSFRTDGSSKFYKDNRWGKFWSIGAGWRLDKENFMKGISAVQMLKLRTSYGQTGNDAGIGNYAWQELHSLGLNNGTEAGMRYNQLDGQSVVWESNNNFDVALEFGLKNGIRGTVEFFNRQSSNLLFDVPVPVSAGVPSGIQLRNIGSMYNRGVELELAYDFRAKNGFTWTPSLNLTHFKNKITKLTTGNPNEVIVSGTKQWKEGRSIYDYWLREYRGVDTTDGRALYTWNPAATTAKTADNMRVINGDTFALNTAAAKEHYCGSAIPDLVGGFTNTFTWKGFDLSIMMTFQIGGKTYDGIYAGLMGYGTSDGKALHKDALKSWRNPGDSEMPALIRNSTINGYHVAQSDRWLISSSYLSLRSINFGYTLPKSLVSKVELSNVRVFFSAENLALFTARKGLNPLQNYTGVTSAASGYLPSRFLTFGLSVNF